MDGPFIQIISPTHYDQSSQALFFTVFLPRIVIATLCGGLVGFERQIKHKVAGLKTNILICVGSCLYTICSVLIASGEIHGDSSRIAAQIVSGIGFLGAGVIFKSSDRVFGLTTAALIWVTAAVGVMVGLGLLWISVVATTGLIILTYILSRIENSYKLFK